MSNMKKSSLIQVLMLFSVINAPLLADETMYKTEVAVAALFEGQPTTCNENDVSVSKLSQKECDYRLKITLSKCRELIVTNKGSDIPQSEIILLMGRLVTCQVKLLAGEEYTVGKYAKYRGDSSRHCPEEFIEPEIQLELFIGAAMEKYYRDVLVHYPLIKGNLNLASDVSSLKELNTKLEEYKILGKKIFVFISADWDSDGKIMANGVFKTNLVKKELNKYMKINIDITENNDDHKEILRHYMLLGMPIYLLYKEDGRLLKKMQGDCLEPEEFMNWLSN